MSEFVDYAVADGIATLTMDDGKANAFGLGMMAAISDGLDRAGEEADVVVVIGRPGLLCGGFDLKVINGPKDGVREMVEAGADLLMKTYMHPQPVIMGCTGHAVAAGALFLCTSDYRIGMAGDFKIGLNETAIGLSLPTFGLELARDRLDNRHLNRATMGAELYPPTAATEIGYLDETAREGHFRERLLEKAVEYQALDKAGYAQVKQRLRTARETLIRSGLQAEMEAR
ncbi:MAG: crotonase/enoyl-CoA hydratase family protein [Rhodospirillaceae bacterium]|nr:crotonase/enoyl-CoA hydratase family protein [Rhodospirillaceae bacterium]